MKNAILDLIGDAVTKRIDKTFVYDKSYNVGEYTMIIPSSANLRRNQKKYPLYDMFLPVLAKHLNKDGLIIDVGANIGDTLVSMIQNCQNPFVCIEPSAFFFKYLKKNAGILKSEEINRIQLVQRLVGTGILSGELKITEGSTATIQISNDSAKSSHMPLDEIVEQSETVLLLKSDVDGYDYDVINSAQRIISDFEPILFFEDDFQNAFQYEKYLNLFDSLKKKNYAYITIFDNFGNILVDQADYATLKDVHKYLLNMIEYSATRTFFYIDIMMATEKHLSIMKNAIEDYKKNWIEKK